MRQIDDVCDGRNKERSTFFKKPGEDRIRVGLLVRTVEKNLKNFLFRCGPESRKTEKCCCVKVFCSR